MSVDVEKINETHEIVTRLLQEKESFEEQITEVKARYLYHPGRNGEAGGKYIIGQLKHGEN